MENKRGMQLAISTIILMILGIVLLIGLISILFMGWDDFKTAIGAALGSDVARAKRNCAIYCGTDNTVDYCKSITVDEQTFSNCNNASIKPKDCTLTCA